MAAIRSHPADISGTKRPSRARGAASNSSRPMQATRNSKITSLQTMQNTIKKKSSPTTATSSGQDIQADRAQSDGDITAPILPRGEANLGPTKAVQPPSQSIRRPRTPPSRPARHRRGPTATGTLAPNLQLQKKLLPPSQKEYQVPREVPVQRYGITMRGIQNNCSKRQAVCAAVEGGTPRYARWAQKRRFSLLHSLPFD